MRHGCSDGHALGVRGSRSTDLEPAEHSPRKGQPRDLARCDRRGCCPPLGTKPVLTGELKAIIINFFAGNKPSVDVDNMSKPILDEMQKIVYKNDRQVRQAEITHVKIGAAFQIMGVSKILVNAIQSGTQFVYVRIEDPADPFPLPK